MHWCVTSSVFICCRAGGSRHLPVIRGEVQGGACTAVQRCKPPVSRLSLDVLEAGHIPKAQCIDILHQQSQALCS
jgi:hypothetical protein